MSSSAKADDPVFRDVSVQPRGCGVLDAPPFVGHDGAGKQCCAGGFNPRKKRPRRWGSALEPLGKVVACLSTRPDNFRGAEWFPASNLRATNYFKFLSASGQTHFKA